MELFTNKGSSPLAVSVWRFLLNGKRVAKGLPNEREATLDAMLFLLDRGANVDTVSIGGSTLLHTAARHGEVELMKVLLDKSADIDFQDNNGRSPLFCAVRCSNLEAVKFLLERGVKANICDTEAGRTPLHYAALHGEIKIMRVLLDAGADGTLKDGNGKMASDYSKKGFPIAAGIPQKRSENKDSDIDIALAKAYTERH